MGILKTAIFSIIAVIGLMILAEISARLAGYSPPKAEPGYQVSKFRASDELAWELVPGWNGVEGEGRVKINSLGYRDDEIREEKPLSEFRVLCLGDSVTFGYLVDQKQPWPQALERIYRGAGKNGRVINAGVPGYSTFQERELLDLKGWNLDPDIVILGYCLNDAVERYSTMAEYGGKEFFLGVDTARRLPFTQWLTRRVAVLRFLTMKEQERNRQKELYNVGKLFENPLSPQMEEAWGVNRREIKGLAEDVESRGKKFLVVIFPYRFQMDLGPNREIPQQRIMGVCESKGIECLDLLPMFITHKDENLFIDNDHLSPAGHFRAAEAIYDKLQSL